MKNCYLKANTSFSDTNPNTQIHYSCAKSALKNHHFLLLQDPSGLPKGHTSRQRGGQCPRCDLAHQQVISKPVLSRNPREMMRHAYACAGKTSVYFDSIWFYHSSMPLNPRNSTRFLVKKTAFFLVKSSLSTCPPKLTNTTTGLSSVVITASSSTCGSLIFMTHNVVKLQLVGISISD